jgi:large subunit ribosomal protein L17
MRHRKKLNHLGRTSSHRKAMLANMASSLILHKRISTTVAKAKALRVYIEPLITKSKSDSTHSRRVVFSYLKNKIAISELFREISPKIADRPGGYTRILKTGARLGDNADMCIIELVDYNENMLAAQGETKTASKRSRRGRGKKAEEGATAKKEKPSASKAESEKSDEKSEGKAARKPEGESLVDDQEAGKQASESGDTDNPEEKGKELADSGNDVKGTESGDAGEPKEEIDESDTEPKAKSENPDDTDGSDDDANTDKTGKEE